MFQSTFVTRKSASLDNPGTYGACHWSFRRLTKRSGCSQLFTGFFWGSIFVPMFALLAVVWILRGLRSLRRERPPVSEKLLRPAGESLRREIEKMDEQLNDIFIGTFFGPALIAATVLTTNSTPVAVIIIITAGVAAFVFMVWKLIHLINRRRDYRLGFAGEQR
jgi:hypothetical protein